mgnify:CR=1 FL=1
MKTYKKVFNKEQKEFLDSIFKDEKYPFYLSANAVRDVDDNTFHFVHHAIRREEPNVGNSGLAPALRLLLSQITSKLNIKYTTIFRCALNITFYNGYQDRCPIHNDHPFDHRQVLIYLNNSNGDTVLLDKKTNKEIKRVSPEAYKILIMDRRAHYHFFPTKGIRKVLIYTID